MIVAALSAQTGECVNCNNAPPPGPFGDPTYTSRVGFNNVADGDYSFAGGENSFAGGLRSFAFGSGVQATGINSVAFGQGTTSTGLSSFALGIGSQSVGDGTFALGSFVKARYSTSFAIGSGTSKYFLESTESETMVIGFNSKNPTLFISRSPNSDEPYELTGMVGIGNGRQPLAKLHIRADKDERTALLLEPFEWNDDTNAIVVFGNAEHTISSHRLFVEGGITSEEVVINSLNENREWPDYVLKEGYKLMPLADLKDFINVNGHLPNVSTAAEVNANGQNLGEKNTMLLEKIEELTLYLIKQQQEIDELKKSLKNE